MSRDELALLQHWGRGRVCLELGAFVGHSTVALAQDAKLVWSVDWHLGDRHLHAGDTTRAYFDRIDTSQRRQRIVSVRARFEQVLPYLQNGVFDLVLVDGAHDFQSCVADLEQALRLLHRQGVLLVHDYGLFEVAEACRAVKLPPPRLLERYLAVFQFD